MENVLGDCVIVVGLSFKDIMAAGTVHMFSPMLREEKKPSRI
jgi:hypothetical protein